MSELTGFIPAGGTGSRLMPHTLETPKPLLLMGGSGRCLIDGPIDVSTEVCDHVWVSTDYMADQVEAYLDGHPSVTTLRDSATVGSAGSLIEHYPKVSEVDPSGDMLIMPSDHIYEGLSILDFWGHHLATEADVTMLTVPPKPHGEYVTVNGDFVTSVEAEPVAGAASSTGIFIIKNRYLLNWARSRRISGDNSSEQYNIYRDIVCAAVGQATVAHFYMDGNSGFWEDAGVPQRYVDSNMRLSGGQNVISPEATVNPEADLRNCVVLGDVTIELPLSLDHAIVSAKTKNGELAITRA